MRHATVQYGRNTVTKTADPDLIKVEVEKSRRAFEIGRASGFFKVPRILDFDEEKGIVTFELLRGIRPFTSSIDRSAPYAERVGRSLAAIHRELSLPPEMVFPLPPEFDLGTSGVFFHGDLTGKNVCIQSGTDSVVIIDWQMTWRFGGRATYGTRYFDLVWFVDYLIYSLKYRYLFRDPVVPAARVFLESYFREAEVSFDPAGFGAYAKAFFARDLPYREKQVNSLHRYLFFRRSQTLKDRFCQSLCALET